VYRGFRSFRADTFLPMCGRYYRRSDKQKIAEAFHVSKVDEFPLPPWDYNIAPSTNQPIIRNNRDTGDRELVSLRWGLIPIWAKELSAFKGFSTINARSETITTSRKREPRTSPPSWSQSFRPSRQGG
jgi:putative SOS response-associated peptidase YedK